MHSQRRQHVINSASPVGHRQNDAGLVVAARQGLDIANGQETGAVVRIVLNTGLDHTQIPGGNSRIARNRCNRRIGRRNACCFSVAGGGLTQKLWVVLLQPVLALRQSLRMGHHTGDAFHRASLGQQIVMHTNRALAQDTQGRVQQQIQRAVHSTFGRVLDGHHADFSLTHLDAAENLVEGVTLQAIQSMAEMLVGGLLGKRALWAQISHAQYAFQTATGRNNLPPHRFDCCRCERAIIFRLQATHNTCLAFGLEDDFLCIEVLLDLAHFQSRTSTLVEQLQDLAIQLINTIAPREQALS